MGNIGSQTGHINQLSEEQWNYSFPRAQATFYQQHHKVLPDRDARQRLRPTNNGEILQSGGTLTGRQNPSRLTLPKEVQIKRCDSAPDLRFAQKVTLDHNKDAIRSKKKYKAPSPPKMRNQPSQWDTNRKPRLFKTRLETIKNNSSPINKPIESIIKYSKNETNQLDTSKQTDNMNYVNNKTLKIDDNLQQDQQKNYTTNNNTIDFKDELQMVTSNLKYNHVNNKVNNDADYKFNGKIDYKEKIKTLDHNIKKYKKPINDNILEMNENKNKSKLQTTTTTQMDENFDKIESDTKIADKKQEPKTFYFGMEETMNYTMDNNNINYDIQQNNNHNDASSFESDLSSWTENNNNDSTTTTTRHTEYQTTSKSGIDLKLRPILPKKPLEIPRFSPAAAWRLLSTMNFNEQTANTLASDDLPVFVEERIEKYSRPPPPTIQAAAAARFSNDKSGDSGISGDAGPAVFDDGVDITLPNKFDVQHRTSWTPQQDLEDDSSMEEYMNNDTERYKANGMTTKPHVFSLSLPRDNHLAAYLLEKQPEENGLKKLKRSVSGVLGNLSRRDFTQPNLTQEQSDNWLLSKSGANSLTNGFNSLEMRYSQKSDEFKPLLGTNKTQNGGRVMYLPEFDGNYRKNRSNIKENLRYRSRSMERVKNSNQFTVYSKSCENITAELQSSSTTTTTTTHSEPEDLQDPTIFPITPNKKVKKFTFQSTIRQIERKIIAEKLSREAERKEKQRLREVEAMRKVEEEFQKKRAREKAAIRQQLRMYSGNEHAAWSSLPPNIEANHEQIPMRTEPDGATSSSPTTSSSPMLPLKLGDQKSNKVYQKNKTSNTKVKSIQTNQQQMKTQVLSEYRQPQRDYKEYRSSTKYTNTKRNKYTTTTVHPQVQCDMPKFKKY